MLFRNPRLDTTTGRASFGLLVGAASGALMNALYVVALDTVRSGLGPADVMSGLFVFFVVSVLFWIGGAFMLAAPGWAILHAMNLRGPGMAVLYGAGLLGGGIRLISPPAGIWIPYAIAGGIVGLIVWATSYRPIRPPVEVFGHAAP